MKNITKKLIKISAIILLIFVVLVVCLGIKLNNDRKKMKIIKIENIDFNKVKNGGYLGKYNLNINSATVNVLVKDGFVEKIDILEHYHGVGYGVDKLTDEIIKKQTLEVDAISGATKSSLVLKKAVENALRQGL